MQKKILCPIINKEILFDECFDCAMVAEGAPKWTAKEELTNIKNFEETCMNCPNHLD